MKPTGIKTILDDLSDGSVIQCFVGKLTKLYELRTIGEGDRQWTKQNGELTDPSGQSIPVEFRLSGKSLAESYKGKMLRFESVKGEKGTHGVKVFDDTYKGKTTRKLCITGQAEIHFATDEPGQASDRREAPPERQREERQSPPAKMNLKRAIMARATVYLQCYDAAVAAGMVIAEKHGFALVPAAVGAMATSFYIDTLRGLDLSAVDVGAVDWAPAKGKRMRDLIEFLNQQVAATAAARMPAPPDDTRNSMPEKPVETKESTGDSYHDGFEDDEIPF